MKTKTIILLLFLAVQFSVNGQSAKKNASFQNS